MTLKPSRRPQVARVAFTERETEIERRLQRRESMLVIWSDIFGKADPAPISYSQFVRLVCRYLPHAMDQTKPRRAPTQANSAQPVQSLVQPSQRQARPLNYDPAISPLGPQPLPPPLPKMPTAIRPGPVQPTPRLDDTGPPPGSNEWKRLHGIETSNRPKELIRQRVPDGKLSGDE
jgi:hypothetical protein